MSSRVNDLYDYYIVRRQLMPFRIEGDVTSGTFAMAPNGVCPRSEDGPGAPERARVRA